MLTQIARSVPLTIAMRGWSALPALKSGSYDWRGYFMVSAPRSECAVGDGGGIEGQIAITILRMFSPVVRVAALKLRLMTLAVHTRLPRTRGVAVDVYDIYDVVVLASIPAIPVSALIPTPAIPISVMVPSLPPLAHINTAAVPIAIVV
jgi:hypothetical protein